ncbi:hypothetical protein C359_01497 [Cryptococcus neoformans Bt120]|nr:hypothetical protein C359_01497 [Cryptococcus neoformans var. grubii Bt120]
MMYQLIKHPGFHPLTLSCLDCSTCQFIKCLDAHVVWLQPIPKLLRVAFTLPS